MKCLRCSSENPDGMRFCGQCGRELSIPHEQPNPAPSLEEKLERIQRYLPEGLTKKILVQRNSWRQSALTMYSLEASIHLLMKETDEARASLDKVSRIRSEVKAAPIQSSFFFRSLFEYDLRCFEDCLRTGHRKDFSEYRRNAFKSGKRLIKTCQKAALFRTESYRLMGIYQWLIRYQKSALKWWHEAMSEGERLGARPQLSRTYAEIAKRFLEVKAETGRPSPIEAGEFIEKAKAMFDDLGLHQDLEELDSVIGLTGSKLHPA